MLHLLTLFFGITLFCSTYWYNYDDLTDFWKYLYNCIIWTLLIFCKNHNIQRLKVIAILNKEVAYIRNSTINTKICPISLKKFDKSFNQTLLYCGHRFDTQYLNQYEHQRSISCQQFLCPVCRKKYQLKWSKFVYDYNFYRNESLIFKDIRFLKDLFD